MNDEVQRVVRDPEVARKLMLSHPAYAAWPMKIRLWIVHNMPRLQLSISDATNERGPIKVWGPPHSLEHVRAVCDMIFRYEARRHKRTKTT